MVQTVFLVRLVSSAMLRNDSPCLRSFSTVATCVVVFVSLQAPIALRDRGARQPFRLVLPTGLRSGEPARKILGQMIDTRRHQRRRATGSTAVAPCSIAVASGVASTTMRSGTALERHSATT